MMNQVKSLPYSWALCGRTGETSPLVEKDGVPSCTNPEGTGEFPSGKLNGPGVPHSNNLQNDAPQVSRA